MRTRPVSPGGGPVTLSALLTSPWLWVKAVRALKPYNWSSSWLFGALIVLGVLLRRGWRRGGMTGIRADKFGPGVSYGFGHNSRLSSLPGGPTLLRGGRPHLRLKFPGRHLHVLVGVKIYTMAIWRRLIFRCGHTSGRRVAAKLWQSRRD